MRKLLLALPIAFVLLSACQADSPLAPEDRGALQTACDPHTRPCDDD